MQQDKVSRYDLVTNRWRLEGRTGKTAALLHRFEGEGACVEFNLIEAEGGTNRSKMAESHKVVRTSAPGLSAGSCPLYATVALLAVTQRLRAPRSGTERKKNYRMAIKKP
jgi:hypothetical protein